MRENQRQENQQIEKPAAGKPANRRRVEVRLPEDVAQRLAIAATIRDVDPSAIVCEALLPYLDFAIPELPEVEPRRFETFRPKLHAR